MGFELNRLMQQYGVATPGRINYSGATPVDPGARPVATDTLTGEALTKAQGDYDNLLAKYNFDKSTQAADTAAYDAYKKEYQTRLQNTPMYMQSQFQTGYEPKSAGLQYAENNMGVKQFNKNIQDWAAQNPNAYSTQINEIADKYGVSAQDIYNATQNRWGNILQAPAYGVYKPTVIDTVVGGGGKDTVTGGGGGGTDTIIGGGGTDTIIGGGGNDTITGGGTNDTLVGGGTNDTLVGGGTNDTLVGGGTNDTLVGGGTNDTLVGGGTNDTLVGGGNNDTLVGGGTNDTLIGGGTNDTLIGGGTNDTLISGGTNDTLIGGGTNDTITGGGNNDSILTTLSTITGGGGNDVVTGDGTTGGVLSTIANSNNTTGTDTVTGGTGNDSVIGALSTDDINRLNNTYLDNTVTGGDSYVDGQITAADVAAQQALLNYQNSLLQNQNGNLITVDQGADNTTLDNLSGYLNNNGVSLDNATDTTSTAQGLVSGLKGLDSGTGADSDFTSATDIGNGLYSVNNSDGTQSIFTDEGSFVGSTGGGFDTVQDWEGNNTRAGVPNVSWQSSGLEAGGWAPESGYGEFTGFGGGGGGGGGKFEYNFDNMAYAKGGSVKTHYQTAGSVSLPEGYINPEDEIVQATPVNMIEPPAPVITEPKAPLASIATQNAPVAPAAVAPKPAALPFGGERLAGIQSLLAAYGPKDSSYGEELKAARLAAKNESDAFAKLLSEAMKNPEDAQSSKAEMYFRLAAAFGAPTKTGHFAENLGLVGKELGDYSKEQRASRQQKLALAMKGQEMKMGAAKDDLRTLQALSAEEMKDKRTIATELIKDYIKSGEPQSTAGKQALDEGLKPGTPEYQKRVEQIGNMNIEGKLAQINASLANVSTAQANLALAQSKFENQKQQQTKLSPTEINMKKEAEDTIAIGKQSLADLKQAYALNPNTLAGGWMDKSQQWLAEAAGSKDPVIVNTRILNNLLGAQGLAKLKSTFGGNPTEGERAILLELEGIGSKTKEERAAIIKRTYKVLQDKQAREQARLDQINSGAYRSTTPLEGGSE